MKTTEEFIEHMVKIEQIEGATQFGHYPFQMVSVNDKGEMTIGSLMLGGDVVGVMRAAGRQIKEGAVKLFLSTDFPKNGDATHDYIAVFTYEPGKITVLAIPYDVNTGEVFKQVTHWQILKNLKNQFYHIAF